MGKHLVFIGAGHAHLTAITNLDKYTAQGHNVTVISAGAFHYYSGMGPGMLSGHYTPEETRFNVKSMTESRGARFVEDVALSVDPEKREIRLVSGDTVLYDVLSFNTGSEIHTGPVDTSFDNVFKVKPIENLLAARHRIIGDLEKGPVKVVVIGGGPAGIEMTNNALDIGNHTGNQIHVTLVARGKILHRFPPGVRKKAMRYMLSKGISVLENAAVESNTHDIVTLEDRREIPYDVAFIATGTKPSDIFSRSGIPTGGDGGLLVNQYLQSVKYPQLFGGGDCISFQPRPIDKVGVYAVRQNPILLENLGAALSGGELKPFSPQDIYLLIFNMGRQTAIFNRTWLTFGGRLAFKLKDRIDRKFMTYFKRFE